jgi:Skp family chaperone for outer membrane proteins
MKKLIFFLSLTLMPLKAHALELLLEENRGESGTIGYVDIDRVFKEYSGTTGAREEFLYEIKKKEDALNKQKTGIFTIKAELAKLRQERAFALTLPSLMETQRSVAQAAAAAQAASLALQASTATVQVSTEAAAAAPQASTAAPQGLPGLSGIDMPGITKVPVSLFKFSVSTSVPEIDNAITKKEADLSSREDELRQAQRRAERELLEYESRKGELLLGRIYVALKELAVKEEVSVVVDKRNILYGQNAVDLTGKLISKLEENGI